MADALTDYLPPACGVDGCTELGPFTTDDGARCFMHAGFEGYAVGADNIAEGAKQIQADNARPRNKRVKGEPADDMNDTAARALAALVLQATADALTTDPRKMEVAIIQLAADLPAPLEVSAAILFATTAIAGTAGLTDQEVFVIGAAFEDQAVEESAGSTGEVEQQLTDEPIERGDDEQQDE